MKKLKKRISNPLTIIAVFAAISESSAAVSLPFLENNERELYIWFLISFPFYLLFLFFLTLNFNYRSLYAPSDFSNDKSFLKVIDNVEHSENKKSAPPNGSPAKFKDSVAATASERAPPSFSTRVKGVPCWFWNAQDPPAQLSLPAPLKDLSIIDARGVNTNVAFAALMETIRKPRSRPAKVIVFLVCSESEKLLREGTLKYSKHRNKSACETFCIVYNLNSQGVTVPDQTLGE